MAKPTANDFLKKMKLTDEQTEPAKQPEPVSANVTPPPTKSAGREGLKHIGGYFDIETVEKVAILRARLSLDNSKLIKRAIDELYSREGAARKFGDR